MSKALSINMDVPTKKEIQKKAQKIIDAVNNGEIAAMNVAVQMNAVEKMIKEVKEGTKDAILTELGKYGKQTPVALGSIIKAKDTAVKYNYENCGDREWDRLNAEICLLDVRLKAREAFLKTITKTISINDEDDGDAYDVHPPVRTSTPSYEVKFT